MISPETLAALEFDRVRKIAASLTASALGNARLAELAPYDEMADAEHALAVTTEMVTLISSGEFPIHGMEDVRPHLQSASVAGAALEPEELLHIVQTARVADALRGPSGTRGISRSGKRGSGERTPCGTPSRCVPGSGSMPT